MSNEKGNDVGAGEAEGLRAFPPRITLTSYLLRKTENPRRFAERRGDVE